MLKPPDVADAGNGGESVTEHGVGTCGRGLPPASDCSTAIVVAVTVLRPLEQVAAEAAGAEPGYCEAA